MQFPNYKFQEIEPALVKFWEDHKINEKVRENNKKGKNFYFLDGPPYTSGRLHLAHAWNYSLKDMAVRYRKMQGFNVWDRNGFDMHGLPTELKVTAKHNLKTKEDIHHFGMDKFIKECIAFSQEMAGYMVKDLQRLGVSLNLSNPYMPITKQFMEGEWGLIKKAYEQKRLYYGEKVLTWCSHCETGLAKHECEYETVKENSIFLKFKLKKKKNEYLIVWTTTPWTIPFNLAVMVNPNVEYVRAKVGSETWILAKALAGLVVQAVAGKKLEIKEEFRGIILESLEYVHPWEKETSQFKEMKKKHPNVHTVILNEQYVDTTAGSGLVHSAPGCGPEDQEACVPYNIPPFNTLTEKGCFAEGMFAGLRAKADDKKIIAALDKAGILIAETEVEHEYPHCWRCHQPVLFRITKQWFFKIEDIKEKILENNLKVRWVPETANNSFKSWVSNLKDNSISRQRYWGTPLPIWKCRDCEEIDIFGSCAELKKKSRKEPENMHLPWIDEITYSCSCGGTKKRVPDIIDVWIDAGTASWNCLDNQEKLVRDWFPADLILEAKEQTRLWFSMLSICSQIAYQQNCYQNVYVYGMLTDIEGRKMSKSLGNIISPYELIDKHGADVLRYYMCQNDAGKDINFNWEECAIKSRHLNILWNIHNFLMSLARETGINPYKLNAKNLEKHFSWEEKYILSLSERTIKEVTSLFETYQLDRTIELIEQLYLELSRTYIQMVRDKYALGTTTEKEVCLYTINQVLMTVMKLFAPIAPFITEAMYFNLKKEFNLSRESLHLFAWPNYEEKKINLHLEQEMGEAQQVIQTVLSLRESAGVGLRWPLKELIIVSLEKTEGLEKLSEVIAKQIKVKEVKFAKQLKGLEIKVKCDYQRLGPVYKELTPKIIAKLAMESPQSILKHLEEEGTYKFQLEQKEVEIKREHLLIERIVPTPYREGSFRQGFIYLSFERNDQLEGEGYTREIMRYVQQSRKEAGLEKVNRINLCLKVSEWLLPLLNPFKKEIKEKTGAETLALETVDPAHKYSFRGQKKIKTETIEFWFDLA